MPDLAELNLVINSSQATTATTNLNTLLGTSQKLEIQVNVLAKAFGNNNSVVQNHNTTLNSLIGSYGRLATSAASFFGIALGAGGIAALAIKSIEAAASQEQLEIAFTTLIGNAEQAKKALADLQDFANHTPFQFQGLAEASRTLLAFGFQASQIPDTIKSIADAAAATGTGTEGLLRISRALGEIQARGRLSGESIRQLASEGLPATQILAQALGVSVPEALQLVEKQALSGSQAIKILLDGFASRFPGAVETLSQSLGGLFSTLLDVSQTTLKKIGAELVAVFNLKGLLRGAITLTDVFGNFFIDLLSALTGVEVEGHKVSDTIQGVAEGLRVLGTFVGVAVLTEGFVALSAAITEAGGALGVLDVLLAANPFGAAAIAIGAAAAALVYLKDVTVTLGGQTVTVGEIVAATWAEFEKLVVDGLKEIAPIVQGVGSAIERYVKQVFDNLAGVYQGVVNYITGGTGTLGTVVVDIVRSTVNIAIGLLKSVIDTLTTVIGRVVDFAKSFTNLDFSSPTSLFSSLSKVADSAVAALDPASAFATVKDKFQKNLHEDFVGDVSDAIQLASGKGKIILDSFVSAFKSTDISKIVTDGFTLTINDIITKAQKLAKDKADELKARTAGNPTTSNNQLAQLATNLGDGLSPAQQKLQQMNEDLDQQINLLTQSNTQATIGSQLAKDRKVVEDAITAAQFLQLPPAERQAAVLKAQDDALAQIRDKLLTISFEKNVNELDRMTEQLRIQTTLLGSDALTQQKLGGISRIGDSLGINFDDLSKLTLGTGDLGETIANVQKQSGLSADQVNDLTNKLRAYSSQLDELDQKKQLAEFSRDLADDFGKPLDEIINKTTSLKKAFKDLFDSILQTLEKKLIIQPFTDAIGNVFNSVLGVGGNSSGIGGPSGSNALGSGLYGVFGSALGAGFKGLFGGTATPTSTDFTPPSFTVGQGTDIPIVPQITSALGNIFNHGVLEAFASGGVVNRPTMFPLAGGKRGLMGEAGPEAIMPLVRGSDGRLGLRGGGSSNSVTNHNYNVSMNVQTPDVNSFRAGQQGITRNILGQLKRSKT